jgi:hypothetical protein
MSDCIINFKNFFKLLSSQHYSVIKLDPYFPKYKHGQDIDILCRNVTEISRQAIDFLSQYIGNEYQLAIKKQGEHVQIDLLRRNEIHFRFDLLASLPSYTKINVKASFFDVVIESSIFKRIEDFEIRIPSLVDEAVLRYIEYQEYISHRPDKIRHLEYILNALQNEKISQDIFFARVHHFIKLPLIKSKPKYFHNKIIEHIELCWTLIKKSATVVKTQGFNELFIKIKKKFS